MFPHTLFRMDGRFMGRVGMLLTTVVVSLTAGTGVQAQDTSSNKNLNPDGLIAFASGDHQVLDIYVMKADGTEVVRLTDEGGNDPAWSPDGRQIAFTSARDGNKEIYVMDADGRHVKRLTNNPGDDGYPTWSPDGQRIAFMSQQSGPLGSESGSDYDVYVMNTDGSDLTLLTHDSVDNGYPAWSPDSQYLSFSTRQSADKWHIYKMRADGSEIVQLTFGSLSYGDSVWSSDGTSLMFHGGQDDIWNLYTMLLDSGKMTKLTNDTAKIGVPSWSSDGQWIAFVIYPIEDSYKSDVYVMKSDGTDKRRLTLNPGQDIAPVWQPLPQTTSP